MLFLNLTLWECGRRYKSYPMVVLCYANADVDQNAEFLLIKGCLINCVYTVAVSQITPRKVDIVVACNVRLVVVNKALQVSYLGQNLLTFDRFDVYT